MVGDIICLCVSRAVSTSLEVARQEDSIGDLHAVFLFKEQITLSLMCSVSSLDISTHEGVIGFSPKCIF